MRHIYLDYNAISLRLDQLAQEIREKEYRRNLNVYC